MLEFIKNMFVVTMSFFSCNALNSITWNAIPLKCVSVNNQECRIWAEIINNINDPYLKLCVFHIVKNINVKIFNLMLRTNETRHITWLETCKWKCRLDASVCNNKQRWNNNKCRCECKELNGKGISDTGVIWNSSKCECEFDKSCAVGGYLGYESCKYRRKLIRKMEINT